MSLPASLTTAKCTSTYALSPSVVTFVTASKNPSFRRIIYRCTRNKQAHVFSPSSSTLFRASAGSLALMFGLKMCKETRFVHQGSGPENRKTGSAAAERPLRSLILLFYPSYARKAGTPLVLVDKRGFLLGGVRGILPRAQKQSTGLVLPALPSPCSNPSH